MRRSYNVYDIKSNRFIMDDALPSAIQKEVGIKNKMIGTYAEAGIVFKKRYRFHICREWDEAGCCPFICVYDLRDGDYTMVDVSAKEVSEKYGIKEKTVEQYASLSKAIKGTWLLFRSDRIPVNKLLTEELAEKWESVANMINPRRKERQAG